MKKLIGMVLSVVVLLGMSGCGVSLLGGRMINIYIMFSDEAEVKPAIEAPSDLKDFSLIPDTVADKALTAYMSGPGADILKTEIDTTVSDRMRKILLNPDKTSQDFPTPPTPFPDDNDLGFPTDEDAL